MGVAGIEWRKRGERGRERKQRNKETDRLREIQGKKREERKGARERHLEIY